MPSLIADNQGDHALQEYAAEIIMDGIERCSDIFFFGGTLLILYRLFAVDGG
jgi:hypothetical protein